MYHGVELIRIVKPKNRNDENTKRERERLLKKLERSNADLALLKEFLSEHLERNAELQSEKVQLLQQAIVNYQDIIRFM